ncbi:MAG: ChrR family anti-sigma-E factor [Spongiibacteraceae bacterium]
MVMPHHQPYHHPAPELLAEYAAGSLQLSHALCVAAHLEFCERCRQQVGKLNHLGAALFDAQRPKSVANDTAALKNRVLAALDANDREQTGDVAANAAPSSAISVDGYRVPRSLGQFIRSDYRELDWSALSTSIKLATLLNDKDGSQVALSRVKPGGKMLHHRHTGEEFTVVLEGSFSDETGVFRKGDFVQRDKRHRHKPVVTKDAECICLMVLDAPIQFTGLFARLLNPIVRRYHLGV